MRDRLDEEFGRLSITEGLATSEQVRISQRIVDAFGREDPRKSLDIVMVDRGYITPEQWSHLLKLQGFLVLSCPQCNKRHKIASASLEKFVTCKHCGKRFEHKETRQSSPQHTASMCSETLTSSEPPVYDFHIGKLLGGKYKILEKVATGGWSTIYKAKRTMLAMDDIIAIKILHLNLSDNPQDIKRFYNEAAAIRELRHPNAIHLYDFDRDVNGTIYMAMEFIHGKNLKEVIKDTGPFDAARTLHVIFQVCDVISTAHKHQKKIIHRDITPQNIMLTKVSENEDFVKVLDFGIVKLRTHDNVSLTGSIVGTPPYMAPEQWKGECDERTDIYSLGVVLYEMLAGEPPFKGDQITLMNKHLTESPQPFHKFNKNLKIPKHLEKVVFRCLEKKPDNRPQSIDELKSLLQKAKNQDGQPANLTRPRSLVVSFSILAIFLAVFISYLSFRYKNLRVPNGLMRSHATREKITTSRKNTNDYKQNVTERKTTHLPLENIAPPSATLFGQVVGIPEIGTESPIPITGFPEHTTSTLRLTRLDASQETFHGNKPGRQSNNAKISPEEVVDNVPKNDIYNNIQKSISQPDRIETLKNEILAWLAEYKRAWEMGDVETLKELGHITSEREENKLRQHYQYVRDVKITIQNEAFEVIGDTGHVILSFDRTDEWTDERGARHKEHLPRVGKTLQKKDTTWKIVK